MEREIIKADGEDSSLRNGGEKEEVDLKRIPSLSGCSLHSMLIFELLEYMNEIEILQSKEQFSTQLSFGHNGEFDAVGTK